MWKTAWLMQCIGFPFFRLYTLQYMEAAQWHRRLCCIRTHIVLAVVRLQGTCVEAHCCGAAICGQPPTHTGPQVRCKAVGSGDWPLPLARVHAHQWPGTVQLHGLRSRHARCRRGRRANAGACDKLCTEWCVTRQVLLSVVAAQSSRVCSSIA